MQGKYSTNEICQLCSITRKQLRYYEESGLLGDVPRIAENNYRYYTAEHIYKIVATKGLRTLDMSTTEMQDIIHGESAEVIQAALQHHLSTARENLEACVRRFEESTLAYSKLMEALSLRKISQLQNGNHFYEVITHKKQAVVALEYTATWEDETYMDVHNIPKIQALAQSVDTTFFGSLTYITYDHFDGAQCRFNHKVNRFKIAVPIVQCPADHPHFDTIPEFRGISAIHVGSPKNGRLTDTYMGLLRWAREQGYAVENWSVEEWIISPMVTNNKDLWVIRITIPLRGSLDAEVSP